MEDLFGNEIILNSEVIGFAKKQLLLEILKRRKELWMKSSKSQELQKIILEYSRRDVIYWINNWGYGYDPRLIPELPALIPIQLYPKQEKFIHWLIERRQKKEHGIVEKCRDSGATFLCCLYSVHCWLFEPGFKATFGSRKEDLVDTSDDPDSIFEKIRQIIDKLPNWMQPPSYNPARHDKFCRIKNPNNGSSITGEGGDNMGRGGRATIYFKDESAHIQHQESVEAAVSGTTDCVIDISTPNGMGNLFARKRHSGKVSVFTFLWTDDPRKNELWYQKKKKQLDSIVFKQEVEVDYAGSSERSLIKGEWYQAAKMLKTKLDFNFLKNQEAQSLIGSLDVSDGGANNNVFFVRQGIILTAVAAWNNVNTTVTSKRAIRLGNGAKLSQLIYDSVGVGAGVRGHLEENSFDQYTDDNLPDGRRMEKAKFRHTPFSGKETPSDENWESFDNLQSNEIFSNLRAEAGWRLRNRFEKTYEFVVEGIQHSLEELICIDEDYIINASEAIKAASNVLADDYLYAAEGLNVRDCLTKLEAQISQPRFESDSGKIRLESKKEMKKRGVESPDFFDALMMCYSCIDGFDFFDAMNKSY